MALAYDDTYPAKAQRLLLASAGGDAALVEQFLTEEPALVNHEDEVSCIIDSVVDPRMKQCHGSCREAGHR